MLEGDKIKVAQGENPCYLLLDQANRHGLIAGASGTGKTVTMKVLAEGFAQAGVPVFMADVKGDVTGMAQPGDDTEKVRERAAALGADGWEPRGCDVRLWDMLGGDGVPVRITISDMGPDLLARLLGLTDVQRGVLAIAFRMADDNGMLLIDLKDLRAMLGYLSEHASEVETLGGGLYRVYFGVYGAGEIIGDDVYDLLPEQAALLYPNTPFQGCATIRALGLGSREGFRLESLRIE